MRNYEDVWKKAATWGNIAFQDMNSKHLWMHSEVNKYNLIQEQTKKLQNINSSPTLKYYLKQFYYFRSPHETQDKVYIQSVYIIFYISSENNINVTIIKDKHFFKIYVHIKQIKVERDVFLVKI